MRRPGISMEGASLVADRMMTQFDARFTEPEARRRKEADDRIAASMNATHKHQSEISRD
jgi:hypothetical protein